MLLGESTGRPTLPRRIFFLALFTHATTTWLATLFRWILQVDVLLGPSMTSLAVHGRAANLLRKNIDVDYWKVYVLVLLSVEHLAVHVVSLNHFFPELKICIGLHFVNPRMLRYLHLFLPEMVISINCFQLEIQILQFRLTLSLALICVDFIQIIFIRYEKWINLGCFWE